MEKGLSDFKLAFAEEGRIKERILKTRYDQLIPAKDLSG